MKDRSDLERERDNLRVELNMLRNKTNLQENNIQELKNNLESKVSRFLGMALHSCYVCGDNIGFLSFCLFYCYLDI